MLLLILLCIDSLITRVTDLRKKINYSKSPIFLHRNPGHGKLDHITQSGTWQEMLYFFYREESKIQGWNKNNVKATSILQIPNFSKFCECSSICENIMKYNACIWNRQPDVTLMKLTLTDNWHDNWQLTHNWQLTIVTTIDAQWEGMGDVGSARYEPALLPPCPTIRVLSYSSW